MELKIWISEEVLVLYFREERCLIMFRGMHSLVFNLFMWVDQLYLLFRVRPRIVVLLVSGIFTVPVRISDLQFGLRHMCRLWHFSIDREAP